jgi:moderate conductance mechanosensitive channel
MTLIGQPLRLIAAAMSTLFAIAGTAAAQTPATATATDAASPHYLADRLAAFRDHSAALIEQVPKLPSDFSKVAASFATAAEGHGGVGRVVLGIILCLVAGLAVEWLVRRGAARLRVRLQTAAIRNVGDRLKRIGVETGIEAAALLGFAVGTLGVLLWHNWPVVLRESGISVLLALLGLRLALLMLTLVLRPHAGAARSLAVIELPVPTARFWLHYLGGFVGWFLFGWAVIQALRVLGMPKPGLQLLAYLMGIGLVAIAVAIIWRRPVPAPTAESGPGSNAGRWMASILAVAMWLIWTVSAMMIFWFLVVAIALPIAIRVGHEAARHVMRPVDNDDGTQGTVSVASVFVEQGLRAAIIVGGIWVLLWGWNLDVGALTGQETGFSRLVRGGLHALIILLAADLAWSLLKALADNALVRAQAAEGLDAEETRRRGRIRTLLPIGRNILFVVLVVMAGLMALASLGVEIGPLIASASVVGVAIGFGAQTIVRDIISGVFYMLDDAFRVGEYIQSGSYKGNVESFSLRSVKLRHQRGPLFTIPFGTLGAVQNMSRDWVMVKDQIRITYDSDVDKAKKLIKQIGLELAADPELAPKILQPLKMQGIEQFGEYSIDIRMKMQTKPGEQFVIRRRANAMIKKAFDENGIKFAFPTVQLAGGNKSDGDAADAEAAIAAQQMMKPKPKAAE